MSAILSRWFPAIGLAVLLIALATLQYRWIGEVSEAERERIRKSIAREATMAIDDFDETISTLAHSLEAAGIASYSAGNLAPQLSAWRSLAKDPALLARVLRVRSEPNSRRGDRGSPPELNASIEQLNEDTQQFEPIAWTPELHPLMRSVSRERRERRGPERIREAFGDIEPTLPAIVLNADRSRRQRLGEPQRGILALVLNRKVLEQIVHRQVTNRLEQTLGRQFAVRVIDRRGVPVPVPESSASYDGWPSNAQALQFDLLRLRASEDVRKTITDRLHRLSGGQRIRLPWLSGDPTAQGASPFAPNGVWILEVAHQTGTLEAAVQKTRLRNLGISAAILSLLATAAFYLLRSAARDRQLAERQLDFVAGLTHELHTPLAAITSAGANLKDGVVSDPERVREYGAMLQKEGARLNNLVGQALLLAGVESSLNEPATTPLAVNALLQEAVDRVDLIAGEQDAVIRIEPLATDDSVNGDRESLLRALTNLLGNAIKYGAKHVTAAAHLDESTVRIAVEDDGPGIAREDVPHLFEPYIRGTDVKQAGTGIGLYLALRIAQQHAGQLQFAGESHGGSGARFVLTLPLAPSRARKS